MKSDLLNHLPVWLILLIAGAAVMVLGAATRLVIGGNSLHLSFPYNIAVMIAGAILMIVALVDFLRSRKTTDDSVRVEKVEVRSITLSQIEGSIRVLVTGRIEPPSPGLRVWLLREHQAQSPGRFHLGSKPALTDKHGQWQQFTYLWPEGTFRIHAVVAGPAAEALFSYYRRAFDHARAIYQKMIDPTSQSFPDWPMLEELPPGCVSDFDVITV